MMHFTNFELTVLGQLVDESLELIREASLYIGKIHSNRYHASINYFCENKNRKKSIANILKTNPVDIQKSASYTTEKKTNQKSSCSLPKPAPWENLGLNQLELEIIANSRPNQFNPNVAEKLKKINVDKIIQKIINKPANGIQRSGDFIKIQGIPQCVHHISNDNSQKRETNYLHPSYNKSQANPLMLLIIEKMAALKKAIAPDYKNAFTFLGMPTDAQVLLCQYGDIALIAETEGYLRSDYLYDLCGLIFSDYEKKHEACLQLKKSISLMTPVRAIFKGIESLAFDPLYSENLIASTDFLSPISMLVKQLSNCLNTLKMAMPNIEDTVSKKKLKEFISKFKIFYINSDYQKV